MKSIPSTPEDHGQAPRAPLPGELERRADQWWWRVRLPGEDRAKARPLRPEGAKAAITERETAEEIALAMWEHAVQENATRQIKMESAEKIERLKAQFLDRVRHFTELVEAANARIEVEAKARAEAEAKLAQMAQAMEPRTQNRGQRTEDKGRITEEGGFPTLQSGPQIGEPQSALPSALNSQDALSSPPAPTEVPGHVVRIADSRLQPEQPAIANAGPLNLIPTASLERTPKSEGPHLETQTGVCECCGATGIAIACLTPIDSGQFLCPRCLTALRADATRIDSDSAD